LNLKGLMKLSKEAFHGSSEHFFFDLDKLFYHVLDVEIEKFIQNEA